ncbi:DUF4189 domain-containing protein [Cognatishimia maritima]|uniref:DUF4189 domain-containing protein n=1 Tax=Cognatishimia maritima TaxID=870908 RepID=A0A1M5TBS5_9RHOB|nr:protein of unknown function [Cognatishimia maritima]
MSLKSLQILGFTLSIFAAAPATAGQCGFEHCWGAIGFNGDGKIGVAYSHWSEEGAYRTAQEHCGWDCAEMRTFKNSCAAIAQGENGSWSWARARTRSGAERTAHKLCDGRSHSCKTVVWACSR